MLEFAAQYLSGWDLALVGVVTIQSAVLAYVPRARLKALVLALPIPFTVALFAVGRQMDATFLCGLTNLLGFVLAVRLLYERWRFPIIPAIFLAMTTYCVIGTTINALLPIEIARSRGVVYAIAAAVFLLCAMIRYLHPAQDDVIHRTNLPVYIKLPIIAVVVLMLVLLKNLLAGFVATFPFVTTVGAYEARRSLSVISAAMPRLVVALAIMVVTIYEVETVASREWALLAGWTTYATALMVAKVIGHMRERHAAVTGAGQTMAS